MRKIGIAINPTKDIDGQIVETVKHKFYNNLDIENCEVKCISLITDEATLRNRLESDVNACIRTEDIIERSVARISKYQSLNTIKIDTVNKTIKQVADEVANL